MLGMFILHMIRKFLPLKRRVPTIVSYTSNPDLQTVVPGWKGTPLDQDGLFINHEYPTVISYRAIIKFLFQRNPQREIKKRDRWRMEVVKDDSWLESKRDLIVWFGHASFFIQLSGIRILVDPMFGKLAVGKRFTAMPLDPHKLSNIDYVLVSHAHYDHCDKKSLQLLASNNPGMQILCGLGLDALIASWVDIPVQAGGWYQRYRIKQDMAIVFVPSRHWANRSLFDVNTTLWGGFVIQHGSKSVYFGGDSGYGSHFKDIGTAFPEIDLALIGAGAYAPAWFMSPHHQDPYSALQAFHDTRARVFIPFHYGTFDSADEPMGEPEQILHKLNEEGKVDGELKLLKVGRCFWWD